MAGASARVGLTCIRADATCPTRVLAVGQTQPMQEPAGIVKLVATEGREEDLIDLLGRMAAAAAKDDGCEIYAVHRSRAEPSTFFLYERYRDKDAFKLHMANEPLKELGGGLRDLTTSMELIVGNIIAGDEMRPS